TNEHLSAMFVEFGVAIDSLLGEFSLHLRWPPLAPQVCQHRSDPRFKGHWRRLFHPRFTPVLGVRDFDQDVAIHPVVGNPIALYDAARGLTRSAAEIIAPEFRIRDGTVGHALTASGGSCSSFGRSPSTLAR